MAEGLPTVERSIRLTEPLQRSDGAYMRGITEMPPVLIEPLKPAWMAAPEIEAYLYRALLEFAMVYLHMERRNPDGALKMTLRVREWLDPLPDRCRGVDVGTLKSRVDELRTLLKAETDLSRIDTHSLIPIPIEMLD